MNCKECDVKKCHKFQCKDLTNNPDWAYSRLDYMSDYISAFGGNCITKNTKLTDKIAVRFSSRRMDSVSREPHIR